MLYETIHYVVNYLGLGLIFTWFMIAISTEEDYSLKEKFLSIFFFPYFICYIIIYVFKTEKEWN